MDTRHDQSSATTALSPIRYQLDLATLGYGSGRLLQRTALRSNRSLRDATVAFLIDGGISLEAISQQDRTILFSNLGRGYASTAPVASSSTSTHKETSDGPDHD